MYHYSKTQRFRGFQLKLEIAMSRISVSVVQNKCGATAIMKKVNVKNSKRQQYGGDVVAETVIWDT